MNAVTFGYGKRFLLVKSGPTSFGMDGLVTLYWVMRTQSSEPVLVGASSRQVLAQMSQAASTQAVSLESDLVRGSQAADMDAESLEPGLDGETVEPVRQRPL